MGRNRSFDESVVVRAAAAAFLRTGFEGTSVDDLVAATGLHRGSLYKLFGSKRGAFLAALEAVPRRGNDELDLLLIALLELAPRDLEIRRAARARLDRLPGDDRAALLGGRLLSRAKLPRT